MTEPRERQEPAWQREEALDKADGRRGCLTFTVLPFHHESMLRTQCSNKPYHFPSLTQQSPTLIIPLTLTGQANKGNQ